MRLAVVVTPEQPCPPIDYGGKLIVVTDAVADHHFDEGGTRAICGAEKEAMLLHDLNLFNLRMRTLGIDPNY